MGRPKPQQQQVLRLSITHHRGSLLTGSRDWSNDVRMTAQCINKTLNMN